MLYMAQIYGSSGPEGGGKSAVHTGFTQRCASIALALKVAPYLEKNRWDWEQVLITLGSK